MVGLSGSMVSRKSLRRRSSMRPLFRFIEPDKREVAIGIRGDCASAASRLMPVSPIGAVGVSGIGLAVIGGTSPGAGAGAATSLCGCAGCVSIASWRARSICGWATKYCQPKRTAIDSKMARRKLRFSNITGYQDLGFSASARFDSAVIPLNRSVTSRSKSSDKTARRPTRT